MPRRRSDADANDALRARPQGRGPVCRAAAAVAARRRVLSVLGACAYGLPGSRRIRRFGPCRPSSPGREVTRRDGVSLNLHSSDDGAARSARRCAATEDSPAGLRMRRARSFDADYAAERVRGRPRSGAVVGSTAPTCPCGRSTMALLRAGNGGPSPNGAALMDSAATLEAAAAWGSRDAQLDRLQGGRAAHRPPRRPRAATRKRAPAAVVRLGAVAAEAEGRAVGLVAPLRPGHGRSRRAGEQRRLAAAIRRALAHAAVARVVTVERRRGGHRRRLRRRRRKSKGASAESGHGHWQRQRQRSTVVLGVDRSCSPSSWQRRWPAPVRAGAMRGMHRGCHTEEARAGARIPARRQILQARNDGTSHDASRPAKPGAGRGRASLGQQFESAALDYAAVRGLFAWGHELADCQVDGLLTRPPWTGTSPGQRRRSQWARARASRRFIA